ncbi:protein YIPF1 [Copidosoma floridanum]|uniref:protein YIPF1 n=1 Tax=Copidosoma floridanum TaxID=29053 RepID=UPI0006C9B5F8|nr:protein YIPF1 [Copidosoma floridanum]
MMNPRDQPFVNYQDFSNPSTGASVHVDLGTPNQQQLFGGLQNDPTGAGMMQDLQGFPGHKDPNAQRSFWTIEYYQKYFNVNTSDVVERLKKSMLPHLVDNFLLAHIRPNPDLYGPFWVCVTLIFTIAISGNIANYFQYANVKNGIYHWKYDFHIVSQAATCIFMYAWFLPLVLWGCLIWSKNQEQQTNQDNELIESNNSIGLLELICLYGYSLTIFIPVAILCTIQFKSLQWSLALIATIMSGGVLLKSLMPIIPGKHKPLYAAFILGLHFILAAGFILYFFHTPSLVSHPGVPSPTTTSTTTTTTTTTPKAA